MLGTLRFVLAYLVFLAHFPESGLKLELGVTAVIIFYFISGYLMMKSFSRFKENSTSPIRSFYLDRCIKIFPQYLIVLFLTFFLFHHFGVSPENTYKGVSFDTAKVLFDSLLLPVNFAIGTTGDLFPDIAGRPIVPPAWSLSVEFHFYLLVPFLVFIRNQYLVLVAAVSTVLLTYSFFTNNPLFNAVNFGYRYVLPMLIVFIFGMMYASKCAFQKKTAFAIWCYFCALFVVVLPGFPAWYHEFVQEIVLGMVVALPLFHYALNFRAEPAWFKKCDQWLGDLSYPIFLSHYLGIYLAQHLFGVSSFGKIYFMAGSVAVFMAISVSLAMLQRRIDASRIHIRGFQSMRS